MTNLTEYMEDKFGEDDAQSVQHFFEQTGLPLPERPEFYRTHDQGAIVFLNDEAVTIRITDYDTYPNHHHPRQLAPLWTQLYEECRLDINPGVLSPVSKDDTEEALKQVQAEGLNVGDWKADNLAYLPGPYSDYVVIIDPGSIKSLSMRVSETIQLLKNQINIEDPQTQLFGHLKQAFEEAWSDSDEEPCSDAFKHALELCRQETDRGLLMPIWEVHGYGRTKEAALNYNKRRQLESLAYV